MKLLCLILLFFIINSELTHAQKFETKPGLSEYRTIQFISMRGISPKMAMFSDNNSEILLNCISPKTRADLNNMGISFNQSQILLLKALRLITEKNDTLKTNFPILGQDKTEQIRKQSMEIALKIRGKILPDITSFVQLLKNKGFQNNTYSLLFSLVVDGLVWDKFGEKGLIPDKKISAEKPFWDGEVWSMYPKRTFSCGTNSTSYRGLMLATNWSKESLNTILDFFTDRENRNKMMDEYLDFGKIKNKDVISAFAKFNIIDYNGNLNFPVINVDTGNEIFESCNTLSVKIADQTVNFLSLDQFLQDYHFRDASQALIIVYHEIMWDLINSLEKDGIIHKPKAFVSGEDVKSEDIVDLIYIVKFK